MVIIQESNYLSHIGVIRRSGRYEWGSGGNGELVVSNNAGFLGWLKKLRAHFTDPEIAEVLGMSTTDLRAQISISTNEAHASNVATAQKLREKGWSHKAIGERIGEPGHPIGEGTVRGWLKPGADERSSALKGTSDMLRRQVDEKGVIDIGVGVNSSIGVSEDRLKVSAAVLKKEGYNIYNIKVPQATTGERTTIRVLAKPDITFTDIAKQHDLIRLIDEHTVDSGNTFFGIKTPLAMDPKKVAVAYAEDGGNLADGVLYVRPGVPEVSIGGTSYAQVRVQVGDSHYLKGMAVYKDDLPDGVDILFNTVKKRADSETDFDAMKPLKLDPSGEVDKNNPFGTQLKAGGQILDANGDKPTSVMNLVYEEGDWGDWSKTIASQVLSKQQPKVAKAQLDYTLKKREDEFNEIMALTNPTVRKKLLREFADGADAASVHLKSAGFPRQGWHAILPVNQLKETEIYAPNYDNGEKVALIRYPHSGTFEIPELVVNNNNPAAKSIMGGARDAVGINAKVAERLSGADFDGDTVLVIPNNNQQIKSTSALEGLKNFEPRETYPSYPGMKVMSNTQNEMGKISNLITDMTILGAPDSEIVRAARHSMVVIDAEKHKLNYKESERREGIKDLKEKYQRRTDGKGGASTIISRAKSRATYEDRKDRPAAEGGPIDPITGKKVTVPTQKKHWKTGEPITRVGQALAETDDAYTLSSGTPIENLYAGYSNNVKALANRARLEMINTPRAEYSKSARETYQTQVDELNDALTLAVANAPRERRAQILARTWLSALKQEDPTMSDETEKKLRNQTLAEARTRAGAGKARIEITSSQWDAIQAGALSDSKVTSILNNADMEKVKEFATPRSQILMTPTKASKAAGLLSAGYTRAQVAKQLGVSLTTLDVAMNGGK